MGLEDVPRCQHVKVNGVQCGSPALRRKRRCYFHEGVRAERAKVKADQFAQRRFEMPVLEDANAVQVALMNVMQMLARGQMEVKIAGLLLYGLQTASANLRHTKFEAEKVTDVVIDCNTVDQTCINGPQWFAHEFAEQEEAEQEELGEEELIQEDAERLEEDEMGRLATAGDEKALAELGGAPIGQEEVVQEQVVEEGAGRAPACREKSRMSKVRTGKRKRPELVKFEDEPDSLAKILLREMGLPLTEEGAAHG
jgi:hypothetical protein